MKIAVCDDDKQMLNMVQQTVEKVCALLHIEASVFAYAEEEELLAGQRKEDFEVIFLDIIMPQMSGFELAKELKRVNNRVCIVYISSKEELVYDSFAYQPTGFIRKRDMDTMKEDICKIMERIMDSRKSAIVTLKIAKGDDEQIDSKEIIYLQSEKNYMKYQLLDGRYIWVRETLAEAQSKLEPYWFCRVNKQMMVNLMHVRKINFQQKKVFCKNNSIYKIGSAYEQTLSEKYLEYKRREL